MFHKKQLTHYPMLVGHDVSSPLAYSSILHDLWWNLDCQWCGVDRAVPGGWDTYIKSLQYHLSPFYHLRPITYLLLVFSTSFFLVSYFVPVSCLSSYMIFTCWNLVRTNNQPIPFWTKPMFSSCLHFFL